MVLPIIRLAQRSIRMVVGSTRGVKTEFRAVSRDGVKSHPGVFRQILAGSVLQRIPETLRRLRSRGDHLLSNVRTRNSRLCRIPVFLPVPAYSPYNRKIF